MFLTEAVSIVSVVDINIISYLQYAGMAEKPGYGGRDIPNISEK